MKIKTIALTIIIALTFAGVSNAWVAAGGYHGGGGYYRGGYGCGGGYYRGGYGCGGRYGGWYGTGIPNGLGWTLFGLGVAGAVCAPPPPVYYIPQPVYYPTIPNPPVIINQY